MTMECRDAASLVGAWRRDGVVPARDLAALEGHVAACDSCSARYGALLPLMARDAGAIDFAPAGELGAGQGGGGALIDAVMDRLGAPGGVAPGRSVPGRAAPTARRLLKMLPAAALFVAGIGLGFFLGRGGSSDRVSVSFSLEAPEARAVSLVGDFNRWNASSATMTRAGPGEPWTITLSLEKDKVYVYNFLIDSSRCVVDPRAVEEVDDGFGGASSLLRL